MHYKEAIDFLMSRLPMFSRAGKSALKPGLNNIIALCSRLGNPQNKFPTIHIAGTNGKGSVCHLLAAAFQNNGYKTGLYTSPHLIDFRERFRINGQLVEKEWVVNFIQQHANLIEELAPSYFELAVAMAFTLFAEKKVDIAIIETGLGGRLDSTNIIMPELSVITQIGWDHMDILGDTLPKIAGEKAGIIKLGIPVVIGEHNPETDEVFIQKAKQTESAITFAQDNWTLKPTMITELAQNFEAIEQGGSPNKFEIQTDLRGVYQKANLTTAMAALTLIGPKWHLDWQKTLAAFSQVGNLTGLQGRWQTIHQRPRIILEVGHNTGGIGYLADNLKQERTRGHLLILMGFVRDKDITGILEEMPKDADYFITQAQVPRALETEKLAVLCQQAGLHYKSASTVASALELALDQIQAKDILLITGSFFIVGEAIPILKIKFTNAPL